MQNNFDLIEKNELNKNSKGGTELLMERLYDGFVPRELLEKVQIIPSRVREIDHNKKVILYLHDLPNDPESVNVLSNEGWRKFDRIVFVSHWQMNAYVGAFGIPFSRCSVMLNSIQPIEDISKKPKDKLKLIYHSTPHRGLAILVPVFNQLCKKYENLELDVISSFDLYGWGDRDKTFNDLIEECKNNPKINYFGTLSNEETRKKVSEAHIFAYPSIWAETSCLCLMEAMSGGCVCVHPNYGALPETAANWSMMYQYNENLNDHANAFYYVLDKCIELIDNENLGQRVANQVAYANLFYNWNNRKQDWIGLLKNVIESPKIGIDPNKKIVYSQKIL